MTKRVELREDALTQVNGGFYYDETRKVIGTSKDGPLYQFVSEQDALLVLCADAIADFIDFLGLAEKGDEAETDALLIEYLLQENKIVPYAA